MKLIMKKLIPFIAALLLLMLCGALSKAETAGGEGLISTVKMDPVPADDLAGTVFIPENKP